MWILIWALVVSNILAVVVMLFVTKPLVRLTFVRGGILIPFILIIVVFGTLMAKGQWENLILLMILSPIGYALLRYDWPRPPFGIGIVLGSIAEESLHKAWALWGWDFFIRPLSLVLMTLIISTIAFAAWRGMQEKNEASSHVVG